MLVPGAFSRLTHSMYWGVSKKGETELELGSFEVLQGKVERAVGKRGSLLGGNQDGLRRFGGSEAWH